MTQTNIDDTASLHGFLAAECNLDETNDYMLCIDNIKNTVPKEEFDLLMKELKQIIHELSDAPDKDSKFILVALYDKLFTQYNLNVLYPDSVFSMTIQMTNYNGLEYLQDKHVSFVNMLYMMSSIVPMQEKISRELYTTLMTAGRFENKFYIEHIGRRNDKFLADFKPRYNGDQAYFDCTAEFIIAHPDKLQLIATNFSDLQYLQLIENLVKNNPSNIVYIDIKRLKNGEYLSIVEPLVKTNGLLLQYLADDYKDVAQVLKLNNIAISQDPGAFAFVHSTNYSSINEYLKVASNAVKRDGLQIANIRIDEVALSKLVNDAADVTNVEQQKKAQQKLTAIYTTYHSICQSALEKNGRLLSRVAFNYLGANEKTIKKQYGSLCKCAVQQNGLAIQRIAIDQLPNNQQYVELCKIAMQQNISAVQYISNQLAPTDLAQLDKAALDMDIQAIKYIPASRLNAVWDDKYALAAQTHSLAQYIPQEHRTHQVNECIVKENMSNLDILTPAIREPLIDEIAHKITTIIVVSNNRALDEHEVEMSRQIYAKKHTEKGEYVVTIEQKDLEAMLLRIKDQNNPNNIKLVLLDHMSKKASKIVNITGDDIANLLEKNENVTNIVLLACHTAAALRTAAETEAIKNTLPKSEPDFAALVKDRKLEKQLPFATTITIEQQELLQESMLQKIVDAVMKHKPLKQSVTIVGSTQVVSVDQKQARFHRIDANILDAGPENIDLKKKAQKYKQIYAELKKSIVSDMPDNKTAASKIKFIIAKKITEDPNTPVNKA